MIVRKNGLPEAQPQVVLADTDASIGTGAAALPSNVGKAFLIQADPDNGADVFLGNSTEQNLQLAAGDVVTIAISNTNLIFAKSASGTQTINILGVK